MTLRTKSRSQQWTVWFCAALVSAGVYVVLSRILYDSVGWNLFDPRQHRLIVPLLALLVYIVKETRWDGVVREEKVKVEGQGQDEAEKVGGESRWRAEEKPDSAGQPVDAASCRVEKEETSSSLTRQDAASTEKTNLLSTPPPLLSTLPAQPPVEPATGEELYARARDLPHQEIPDFDRDGPYLKLLGASAAKGHAPALTKLGEYAMRRSAWVEAYYWMVEARRNGMHGLSPTLREIRTCWARDGFPVQASNVNELFTIEAGSLGRALLCVDSGHEAAGAKEFLRTHYPDFLR